MVKMVIASRSEKLCDRSQKIHLSRTASSSIRMALIHTNAVRNNSRRISVRGRADICGTRGNKLCALESLPSLVELKPYLQASTQYQQQQAAAHRGGEAEIKVLMVLSLLLLLAEL